MPVSLTRQVIGLTVACAVCIGAAAVGGAVTYPRIESWYAALTKPPWTPPGWLFGPVWSVLYGSMALSAWLVWRRQGFAAAGLPLLLFAVQLFLNLMWSVLFFGLKSPGLALLDIVLLLVAIAATLVSFWRRSAAAGGLLVPYLAWVGFATALNFAIWRLNS